MIAILCENASDGSVSHPDQQVTERHVGKKSKLMSTAASGYFQRHVGDNQRDRRDLSLGRARLPALETSIKPKSG